MRKLKVAVQIRTLLTEPGAREDRRFRVEGR